MDHLAEKLGYRRSIFLSIILIALGVVLINAFSVPPIGVVFIAVGGFFFIVGMAGLKKRNENM
ncbi:MAG: hypothetical protein KDH97_11795 [Calditrichaeota bacterium]|nr:hypothetical protein [Calditrichota bacterium]MCB9087602.1 hypothetical protein [Calditrichia bacterium]MCB0290928.1 hypothetical protein [Calditrichota bacterium]MCB0298025.1 hypothetical protein [Calditrichota bacterium]MCB0305617.1 hypothetical protein [Calditrichota bacterium]